MSADQPGQADSPADEPPLRIEDFYCVKVIHYGALGIEEGSFHHHAIPLEMARVALSGHLATLGPGDKAEVVLTRGAQRGSPLSAS